MAKTVGYNVKISGTDAATGSRQVTSAFRNIRGEAQRTSAQLNQLGQATGKTGGAMSSLATGLIGPLGVVGAFGALSAGLFKATQAAMQFETAFAEVTTLLPVGSQEIGALNEGIREMSRLYGQGPTETAKATYQIISAGASTAAEAMTVLNAANQLALGGVTDVKTAADGLTTILNAYGMSADEATTITDDMFIAVKAGKTTVGELSESMSFVASISAQAGVSLQEVLASTAALTKGGVPTQRAMQGIAQVMASIIKPSSEAAKMADQLGFDFSAAALQAKGLHRFLADLAVATEGNAEVTAQFFGGVEALVPVLSLAGKQAQDFTNILGDMEGNFGDTAEAARKMEETTAHQLKVAEVNWVNFTVVVGSAITRNILGPIAEAGSELMGVNAGNAADVSPEAARYMATRPGGMLTMQGPEGVSSYGPIRYKETALRQRPLEGEYRPFSEVMREQQGLPSLDELAALGQEIGGDISASIQAFYKTLEGEVVAGSLPGSSTPERVERFTTRRALSNVGATGYEAIAQRDVQIHQEGLRELQSQWVELDAQLSTTGITIDDLVVPAAGKWYESLDNQNRIMDESVGVLSRLAPQFSSFFQGFAQAAQGDIIGAAFSGINGILDLFGVFKSESSEAAQAMQRAAQALREIKSAASSMASDIGGSEILGAKKALLDPIRAMYEAIFSTMTSGEAWEGLEEQYGTNARAMAQTYSLQSTLKQIDARSPMYRAALETAGFDTNLWSLAVKTLFGTENLTQVASQMFSVEEAFSGLTDTLEDSGNAAKRLADIEAAHARRWGLGEEMLARTELSASMQYAGRDVFLQQLAYQQFQSSIEAIRQQEYARRSSTPSTGGAARAPGETGGEVGGQVILIPPTEQDVAITAAAAVESLNTAFNAAAARYWVPVIVTSDDLFQFPEDYTPIFVKEKGNIERAWDTITKGFVISPLTYTTAQLLTLPDSTDFFLALADINTYLTMQWDIVRGNIALDRKSFVPDDLITLPGSIDFLFPVADASTGFISAWDTTRDAISLKERSFVPDDLITLPDSVDFFLAVADISTDLTTEWDFLRPGISLDPKSFAINELLTLPDSTDFFLALADINTYLTMQWDIVRGNIALDRKSFVPDDLITLPGSIDFLFPVADASTGFISAWDTTRDAISLKERSFVPDDLITLPDSVDFFLAVADISTDLTTEWDFLRPGISLDPKSFAINELLTLPDSTDFFLALADIDTYLTTEWDFLKPNISLSTRTFLPKELVILPDQSGFQSEWTGLGKDLSAAWDIVIEDLSFEAIPFTIPEMVTLPDQFDFLFAWADVITDLDSTWESVRVNTKLQARDFTTKELVTIPTDFGPAFEGVDTLIVGAWDVTKAGIEFDPIYLDPDDSITTQLVQPGRMGKWVSGTSWYPVFEKMRFEIETSWEMFQSEFSLTPIFLDPPELIDSPTTGHWSLFWQTTRGRTLTGWEQAKDNARYNLTPQSYVAADLLTAPSLQDWLTYMQLIVVNRASLAYSAADWWLPTRHFLPADLMQVPTLSDWRMAFYNTIIQAGVIWYQDVLPGFNLAPRYLRPADLVQMPEAGAWLHYFAFETDMRDDIRLSLQTTMNSVQVDLDLSKMLVFSIDNSTALRDALQRIIRETMEEI